LRIAQPHQIGSDLVANAAAAYDRFKANCLVVDFGTALTFTAIDANGAIKGVSIAPGLRTAMKALSGNTAQLPEIPLEIPQKAIGTNTVEAIQSGIVLGYVGLVSYLVEKIKEEMGGECTVVATGGLSFVMEPLKHLFAHIDPRLTLDGLAVIDRWVHRGA
jgi:type III pantothenate kinase